MNRWFIYVLRDPISWDVRYVGKTNDPVTRLKGHLRPRARAKHYNARWIASLVAKGLVPLLEVIDAGNGNGHPAAERAWIKRFRALGCRLTNTGDGGLGFCDTPETREKIAAANRGKRHSEDTRRQMSEARKGVRPSDETREKCAAWQRGVPKPPERVARMAAAKRGKPMHPDTRAAIIAANTGRPMSDKCREALLASKLGKSRPDETRQKIAASLRGRKTSEEVKAKLREAQKLRRANERAARLLQTV